MTEQELMLTSVLDCRRVDLYAEKLSLSPAQERFFRQMQARRAQGEPLQYILGETEFMGMKFAVDERVLIPRPETEILVEGVLARAKSQRCDPIHILDLGTGSGCIAVSLAKHFPLSEVCAVDISKDALSLAQENARQHGVENQIQFQNQCLVDCLNERFASENFFDIIVSNPPYIRSSDMDGLPDDVRQEPRLALDGGEAGLKYYIAIIEKSAGVLKPGGLLALEIGDGQRVAIEEMLKTVGFTHVKFIKDCAGTDRVVFGTRKFAC
ncbi:MAG: peptide chain release factor N(5)-glutamine methyltransferase [Candidatus Omnitrophica bacterium]|nr:peptide chain release factor N(5)-glutamine methyltransferase [Candidatus Omnitrophota bacterium]